MSTANKIKITQTGSVIDQKENAKRTMKALGLGRPNYFVVKNDSPQIRGMINAVRHLVRVEDVK
ncbi:MAG TPA: 50S ribosomal protein L30 [Bacteroidetes bacterium]|nr:MAG: 50S ribosomal protein L30 [Ignavibacteria bacterium GWA2_54_16]HCA81970.1 50S ribosomal protein L30 [Bacteroidota bacterium]